MMQHSRRMLFGVLAAVLLATPPAQAQTPADGRLDREEADPDGAQRGRARRRRRPALRGRRRHRRQRGADGRRIRSVGRQLAQPRADAEGPRPSRHRGPWRQDRHGRRLHRLGAPRRGRRRVRVRSGGRQLARARLAQGRARLGRRHRAGRQGACVGGRGVDNTFTVGTHEVYDPATNTWTERASMPTARDHLALVAIDGKIHAIGGRVTNPQSRIDVHEIYDPKTNSWSSGPPLPTARSGLAYTSYHGMIVVLGGELAPNTFAQNEAFDPKSMAWRTLASMPPAATAPAPPDRQQRLSRRGIAQARLGRRHRRADRVHDAVTLRGRGGRSSRGIGAGR